MFNLINVYILVFVLYDLLFGFSLNFFFIYIFFVIILNYVRFFLMIYVGMVVLLNFFDVFNRVKKSMFYKFCGSMIIN